MPAPKTIRILSGIDRDMTIMRASGSGGERFVKFPPRAVTELALETWEELLGDLPTGAKVRACLNHGDLIVLGKEKIR